MKFTAADLLKTKAGQDPGNAKRIREALANAWSPRLQTELQADEIEESMIWNDAAKAAKRLRQSAQPTLNPLETEWLNQLKLWVPERPIFAQALTFRLANGLRYTPDLFAFEWPGTGELEMPTAWEVKGKRFMDDAVVKLKVFAGAYTQIRVLLVWKDWEHAHGTWRTQRILA